MSYHVDALVIGAGVVGLACARQLAQLGLETMVLEQAPGIGQGISSRNSEVIHAGIYYPPASLKARLCVEGRHLLYDYCTKRHIPHAKLGKWIVASSDDQISVLEGILERALANGCDDLYWLEKDAAVHMEPELFCERVLCSPSTGIIDSHAFMVALLADFESCGGVLAPNSPVLRITMDDNGFTVFSIEDSEIKTRYLINAAGLNAPQLAALMQHFPKEQVPVPCYAKGSYFTLSGKSPFKRLIYPVPQKGGLGVHLTLDLQGQARFGPDVEWVDSPEYDVSIDKRDAFSAAISRYWPKCDPNRLSAGYAGVRPKLGSKTDFAEDFIIQDPAKHGITGLVHLFGIESPGLTAALALAREVQHRLELG